MHHSSEMKIGDYQEVEEFISQIIAQLRSIFNWQLFTSFVLFYFAYLTANFTLGSYLLCATGLALLIATYRNSISVTQEGRAVLITGCDFGYGYELAKKLRASNFTVFAGCSDAKSNGAISLKNLDNQTGRLHVIQMDVSNQEEVDDALHYVKEHLPENGLWGIVNNADESSCPGFLEWSPIENYEKTMAVNLFGAIRVTNSFLPLIRESQGRIVNVSSLLSRVPSPFNGPYAIAKSAIDSYSAILRAEMKRFNVQVVVVEPGSLAEGANFNSAKREFTRMIRRTWDLLDDGLRQDYGQNYVEQQIEIGQMSMQLSETDIGSVVEAMVKAVSQLHPRDRYAVASMTEKCVAYGMQYLPLWLTDHLLPTMEAQTYLSYLSYLEPFILI